MSWWTGLHARVRALFRPRALERELDEEIAFHLAMEAEKELRSGLAPEQARRNAVLSFGSADRVREEHRDVRGFPRSGPAVAQNAILVGLTLPLFGIVPDEAARPPRGRRPHVRSEE